MANHPKILLESLKTAEFFISYSSQPSKFHLHPFEFESLVSFDRTSHTKLKFNALDYEITKTVEFCMRSNPGPPKLKSSTDRTLTFWTNKMEYWVMQPCSLSKICLTTFCQIELVIDWYIDIYQQKKCYIQDSQRVAKVW